jgi:hypothetical protein
MPDVRLGTAAVNQRYVPQRVLNSAAPLFAAADRMFAAAAADGRLAP